MRSHVVEPRRQQHLAQNGEHSRRPCPASPWRAGTARPRYAVSPGMTEVMLRCADAAGQPSDALRQRDEILGRRAGFQQSPAEQPRIGQEIGGKPAQVEAGVEIQHAVRRQIVGDDFGAAEIRDLDRDRRVAGGEGPSG